MSIFFHTIEVKNPLTKQKAKVSAWIKQVIAAEQRRPGEINVIFCSDSYLSDINKKFLSRDYFTDVITFDYSENKVVSGDIFISTETVMLNSRKFNTAYDQELRRVIIHGVLHLMNYDDQTPSKKKQMTRKEDSCLLLLGE